jgi:hypothetical protein
VIEREKPNSEGWHLDPEDAHGRERYFDGGRWTKRLRWGNGVTLREGRRPAKDGGALPDWYMRPPFAIAYLAIVAGSFALDWRIGLGALAWLPLAYLRWKYLRWLGSDDGC